LHVEKTLIADAKIEERFYTFDVNRPKKAFSGAVGKRAK